MTTFAFPVGKEAKDLATEGLLCRERSPKEAGRLFMRAAVSSSCSVGAAVYLAHASNCFGAAGEHSHSARLSQAACDAASHLGTTALELVDRVVRGPTLTH